LPAVLAGTFRRPGGCLQPVLLRGRADYIDGRDRLMQAALRHSRSAAESDGQTMPRPNEVQAWAQPCHPSCSVLRCLVLRTSAPVSPVPRSADARGCPRTLDPGPDWTLDPARFVPVSGLAFGSSVREAVVTGGQPRAARTVSDLGERRLTPA